LFNIAKLTCMFEWCNCMVNSAIVNMEWFECFVCMVYSIMELRE
jgi:hypothetical protein